MASARPCAVAALATLLLLPLAASDARAFRIIASSSGGAGIAQAPGCDTGFDGGFEVSTSPLDGGGLPSVVAAGGSKGSRSRPR